MCTIPIKEFLDSAHLTVSSFGLYSTNEHVPSIRVQSAMTFARQSIAKVYGPAHSSGTGMVIYGATTIGCGARFGVPIRWMGDGRKGPAITNVGYSRSRLVVSA